MKITVQAGKLPVKLSKRQVIAPGATAEVEASAFITQLIGWGDLKEVQSADAAPANTKAAAAAQPAADQPAGGSK